MGVTKAPHTLPVSKHVSGFVCGIYRYAVSHMTKKKVHFAFFEEVHLVYLNVIPANVEAKL